MEPIGYVYTEREREREREREERLTCLWKLVSLKSICRVS